MGFEVLQNQKVWFDGYDITGALNAVALEYSADAKDFTVLGNDTHISKGGLFTAAVSVQGFYDAQTVDAQLMSSMGAAGKIITVGDAAAAGNVAYSLKATVGSYKPGAAVGNPLAFSLDAAANGKLVRSTIVKNGAAVAATGSSAPLQLGAVATGKKLYAILHALTTGGTLPTLDMIVESDNGIGFASPVTQATFAQVIAPGAQWLEVSGPITDDWWRVTYTIGGTLPSFDFVAALAIL